MGVHTGCFCTFAAQEPMEMVDNIICGKAMDDRACCAALIEYARQMDALRQSGELQWDIYRSVRTGRI